VAARQGRQAEAEEAEAEAEAEAGAEAEAEAVFQHAVEQFGLGHLRFSTAKGLKFQKLMRGQRCPIWQVFGEDE